MPRFSLTDKVAYPMAYRIFDEHILLFLTKFQPSPKRLLYRIIDSFVVSRARAEAYLHAKFHLDPSNRLTTVHKRYRQTGQTTDR